MGYWWLYKSRETRATHVPLVYAGQLEKRPIWAHGFRGSSLWSNYQRLGGVVSWPHCFQAFGETGHHEWQGDGERCWPRATEKKREKEGGNKVCKWTEDKTIFQRHSPNDQLPLTRPHLLRAHQPMNSMVGWALNILASSWTNHLLVTPSARRQAFNLRMSFFGGRAHIWYLNLNTMWWPTPPGDSTRMKDATDEATSPWSSKNHDPKWQFPYLKHVHRHTVLLPTWNRLTEYSLSMRHEIS